MRPVATRPDDVNACLTLDVGERNDGRLRHCHGEQSSEFVGRLALGPQRNEEAGNLRWSGIARQDLGQRRSGLVTREVATGDELADER